MTRPLAKYATDSPLKSWGAVALLPTSRTVQPLLADPGGPLRAHIVEEEIRGEVLVLVARQVGLEGNR